jgi:hypothetical protein
VLVCRQLSPLLNPLTEDLEISLEFLEAPTLKPLFLCAPNVFFALRGFLFSCVNQDKKTAPFTSERWQQQRLLQLEGKWRQALCSGRLRGKAKQEVSVNTFHTLLFFWIFPTYCTPLAKTQTHLCGEGRGQGAV